MKKAETFLSQNEKNSPLDEYAGQWVAFANGKVVAHQTSLGRLMKKVKDLKKVKKPSILLVPKKKEGPYV